MSVFDIKYYCIYQAVSLKMVTQEGGWIKRTTEKQSLETLPMYASHMKW